MRSIARALYIRSLSSSHGKVPGCSTSSYLISQRVSFCTESDSERGASETGLDTDDDRNESRHKGLFLERLRGLPRDRSLVPLLQKWIKAGNNLGPFEMKTIFGRLEWKQKFPQALEVVEWLLDERPFELVEHHYARWLTYLSKVGGYEQVEKAFKRVPLEFQKEVVYCRLFDAFLEHHQLNEAIFLMKKMRKQKVPVPVYMWNNLISYLDRNSMTQKISPLLKVMEEQQIAYNLQTYNILLSCSSRDSDLGRMEQIWRVMQANPSVTADFVSYATLASAYFFAGEHEKALAAAQKADKHLTGKVVTVVRLKKLIALYGALKNGDDVSRIHEKLKAMPGRVSVPSYMCVIEAYGEAGLVDDAEEVMKEMKAQRGLHHLVQYNTILGVYCKNGMIKNAEEALKKLVANHKPDIITHSLMLLGYLKSEHVTKALSKLKTLVSIIEDGEFKSHIFLSRSWLLIMNSVFGLLAKNGDQEHARVLLTALQEAGLERFPQCYHFITKV